MLGGEGRPRISVVVASQDAEATIVECIGALARDAGAVEVAVELIVADGSRDRSLPLVHAAFPQVRIVSQPPGTLVPELWSAGLRVARGELVGITTAHCVPVEGWIQAMIAAHGHGCAGVGGPIDCDRRAGFVDRAIYFTRYSAYMPPLAARDVADLPGDNASYDAAVLRQFPAYVDGVFWEPFLHAEMRRAGLRLCLDPRPVVRYVRSHAVAPFLTLRFAHGWHFGAVRARGEAAARCLARAAAFPLVPLVLAVRIITRTRARPAARRQLLAVLPLVFLFLSAFAAGECLAALAGAFRHRSNERLLSDVPGPS
jgi:glycosyltransferase involved in cell wall biosynthesis